MKARKTPQEKKKYSLEKDRPSYHAKSDKVGRVAKPRAKKKINEAFRRKIKEKTRTAVNVAADQIEDELKEVKREKWWKSRPKTLGEAIKDNKKRRIEMHGAKQKRKSDSEAYKRGVEDKINEVKGDPKYKSSSEEKIKNVAFSRYKDEIRKNKNTTAKTNQESKK